MEYKEARNRQVENGGRGDETKLAHTRVARDLRSVDPETPHHRTGASRIWIYSFVYSGPVHTLSRTRPSVSQFYTHLKSRLTCLTTSSHFRPLVFLMAAVAS